MIERRKVLKGIGLTIGARVSRRRRFSDARPRNRLRRFRSRACTRRQACLLQRYSSPNALASGPRTVSSRSQTGAGRPVGDGRPDQPRSPVCGCRVHRPGDRLGQGHQDACHQRIHRLAGYASHGAQGLDVARRHSPKSPLEDKTEGVLRARASVLRPSPVARRNTRVIWRGRSASIPSAICRSLRSGLALPAWRRFAPNRSM